MDTETIIVDDTAPFGTYSPNPRFVKLIKLIRRLPQSWLGKRLMFVLRRMARKDIGDCVDMELFDANMRLYKEGNASEKRALFAPQFFDFDDRASLAKLAAPNAVFVDIGANIGLYSFSTSKHFKHHKGTRIISVEPHPDIHRRLAFNKNANPDLPIELFQGGIGEKAGTMQLLTGQGNIGQTRILKDGEKTERQSIPVKVVTLMELVKKFDLSRIDGMKVDVEGFEEAVLLPFLADAPDSLLPQIIVIEDNQKEWQTDLVQSILNKGYEISKKTKLNLIFKRVPSASGNGDE